MKEEREETGSIIKKVPILVGSLFLAAAIIYNSMFVYGKKKPKEDKTR